MTAIIGPHIRGGVHRRLDLLQRWQPRLVLVQDPNPDEMRQLRERCPNTVIVGRVYQKDGDVVHRIRNNPIEAAEWAHGLIMQSISLHVDFWHVENEVLQTYSELQLLNVYALRRMKLADDSGYKCAIGVFSVGNPDLPAHDRMALWRQFYPAMTYAQSRGHIVAVHQYGKPTLWQPDADWYIHRLEHQVLPLLSDFPALRFAVTEFGIDGLINTPGGEQNRRGWKSYTTAEQYAQDLINIGQYLEKFNSRILGYAVFTLGGSGGWHDYDIDGEVAQRLADHYATNPGVGPVVVEPEEVKEESVSSNNPLAENCREFRTDSSGKVVGIKLGITPVVNSRYKIYSVRLRDEYEAQGNTVARCKVLDKNNVDTGVAVRMAWPGQGPQFQESALPGNPSNEHFVSNKFNPEHGVGPLALFVGQHNQPQSDIVYGFGLPAGHHVSFDITFRERADDVVVPPTDPPTDPGDKPIVSPEVVMQVNRNRDDIAELKRLLATWIGGK